jgi:hypothetical protein
VLGSTGRFACGLGPGREAECFTVRGCGKGVCVCVCVGGGGGRT